MVQDHALDWWLRGSWQATGWDRVTEFLGTLSAPLFLFLMGFSLALSGKKRREQGLPNRYWVVSLLRRGVFLILQGYLVTGLTFYTGSNLPEIGAIDILHCIGLSMIVLIPLSLLRAWPLTLIVTILIAIVSPYAGDWNLLPWVATWVNGTTGTSYFPLLPFVTYAFTGLTLGQAQGRAAPVADATRRTMVSLLPAGALLMVLVPFVPPDLGFRFPRPVFMLFSGAVILWSTAAFFGLSYWRRAMSPLAVLGQAAMPAYVLHHLIGFRLFYLAGWVTGHSWQGHYGIFAPGAACILLIALLLVLYAGASFWLAWRPLIGPAALVRRFAPTLGAYW